MQKKMLEDLKLKKPISPDQVAEKILYLASDKSLEINGQIIRVDGNEKVS